MCRALRADAGRECELVIMRITPSVLMPRKPSQLNRSSHWIFDHKGQVVNRVTLRKPPCYSILAGQKLFIDLVTGDQMCISQKGKRLPHALVTATNYAMFLSNMVSTTSKPLPGIPHLTTGGCYGLGVVGTMLDLKRRGWRSPFVASQLFMGKTR